MSSLSWGALNINGEELNLPTQAFVRCDWDQARLGYLSSQYPSAPTVFRCCLRIGAANMVTIDLQIEIDVLQMLFNIPTSDDEAAFIILKLCVPRPCEGLRNGGMAQLCSHIMM
jgi:hypothetical protein